MRPAQNAQHVVGEKGEEEGQHQEDVRFGLDDLPVFFRHLFAHKAVDRVPAHPSGQEEDQHRPQGHGAEGHQEGGPGAEEHAAGQGGDVAGDGGQHHREQLDQEET